MSILCRFSDLSSTAHLKKALRPFFCATTTVLCAMLYSYGDGKLDERRRAQDRVPRCKRGSCGRGDNLGIERIMRWSNVYAHPNDRDPLVLRSIISRHHGRVLDVPKFLCGHQTFSSFRKHVTVVLHTSYTKKDPHKIYQVLFISWPSLKGGYPLVQTQHIHFFQA